MRFLINQGAARLRAKASESRVRVFILVHLEYFLADPKSMKVLSHKDDVLREELGADIASLKQAVLPLWRGSRLDVPPPHELPLVDSGRVLNQ
jgi:hypothetical protein